MQSTWLVILPPIIVLINTFITKNLHASLLLGLLSAGLIATDGNPINTLLLCGKRLYEHITTLDNVYLYLFLISISILVVILDRTGGARAFALSLTKRIRSARATETASLLMSIPLGIDDYLSALTAGYVMRPLTDRFSIPRAKLAFLVRTLTGPLVIIIPISSWLAMITGQLKLAGISPIVTPETKIIGDPYSIYVQSIPFIFYSLLMIIALWFIVRRKISYGPMYTQEKIAHQTGNLFGGKEPIKEKFTETSTNVGSLSDLFIPLLTLIGCLIIGILYAGGFYIFGGPNSFVQALQNNNQTSLVLCVTGFITLAVSFAMAFSKRQIAPKNVSAITYDGFLLIYSAIAMLILVSTLGTMLKDDLKTGSYLATTFLSALNLAAFPCMFFIVAAATSIIIGSSWGTIALLVPIAVPMLTTLAHPGSPVAAAELPLIFPLIGAIFAGAICGDHISPLSQTTILVATSCGAYALDHIKTQLPYAIPSIVCSIIAFALAGYFISYGYLPAFLIAFVTGVSTNLLILFALNKMQHRKL